jgi:DNA invertase Pin-like site-specific DNA recombinase
MADQSRVIHGPPGTGKSQTIANLIASLAAKPTGSAMAGMLAVVAEFEREILREQVKAGIAQARSKGKTLGRPKSAVRECRYPEACIARKGLRNQRPDNWASA